MIKHLMKYRALVAAIFILAPLLFWFSYSELVQFVGGKENSSSQDYCEIAKVTKAETSKVALSDLIKLKVEKSICMHCIDETSIYRTSYYQLDIEHFYSPQKTTPLYLYNRLFLI